MDTREAPGFWGLHKNKNCALPLMPIQKFEKEYLLKQHLSITQSSFSS